MPEVYLHTKSADDSSTAAEVSSISYPSTMFHVKKCMYFKCACVCGGKGPSLYAFMYLCFSHKKS